MAGLELIVPYIPEMLCVETIAALVGQEPMYCEVDGERSYHDLLAKHWREGMIIVEQDIVAEPAVVDDLRACPHSWCVVPYRGPGNVWLDQSLGCTKLGGFPFEFRLERDGDLFPIYDWRRLDVRVANLLTAYRVQRHVHGLSVRHLHTYT